MVRGGVGRDTDLITNMSQHVVIGIRLHIVIDLLGERAGLSIRALMILLVVGQVVGHNVDSTSAGDEVVEVGVPLVNKVPNVLEVSTPPGGRKTTSSRSSGSEH
jgi:hypothetical protein